MNLLKRPRFVGRERGKSSSFVIRLVVG